MQLFGTLSFDYFEGSGSRPSGWSAILKSCFRSREFMAVTLVRVQYKLHSDWRFVPLVRTLLYNVLCSFYGVDIHPSVAIGHGSVIHHCQMIIIGCGVRIGERCHIYHGVTIGARNATSLEKWPRIGNGVTIYTGSVIAGDLSVGDETVIGSCSLVIKDVPARSIVYGQAANIRNF